MPKYEQTDIKHWDHYHPHNLFLWLGRSPRGEDVWMHSRTCAFVWACVALWGSGCLSACVCACGCKRLLGKSLPWPALLTQLSLYCGGGVVRSEMVSKICCCQHQCYRCKTLTKLVSCCTDETYCMFDVSRFYCFKKFSYALFLHHLLLSVSVCRVLWYAGEDAGMKFSLILSCEYSFFLCYNPCTSSIFHHLCFCSISLPPSLWLFAPLSNSCICAVQRCACAIRRFLHWVNRQTEHEHTVRWYLTYTRMRPTLMIHSGQVSPLGSVCCSWIMGTMGKRRITLQRSGLT